MILCTCTLVGSGERGVLFWCRVDCRFASIIIISVFVRRPPNTLSLSSSLFSFPRLLILLLLILAPSTIVE